MRRLLIILMLMVVPFQLSWAAAAAYCQHESNPAVSHFGHHTHQHSASTAESKSSMPKAQLGVDDDCATCHLGGIGIAPMESFSLTLDMAPANVRVTHNAYPISIRPHRPERPQWQRAVS